MANINFNKVILGGRITNDLEMRMTQQGTGVLVFSIATQRKNDKNKTSDFINCKAFGKNAENITRFFHKGSSIIIVGSIQTSNWQDQQGNKRYSTDVMVDEFYFADSKNEVGDTSPTFAPTSTPKFEEIDTDDSPLPF